MARLRSVTAVESAASAASAAAARDFHQRHVDRAGRDAQLADQRVILRRALARLGRGVGAERRQQLDGGVTEGLRLLPESMVVTSLAARLRGVLEYCHFGMNRPRLELAVTLDLPHGELAPGAMPQDLLRAADRDGATCRAADRPSPCCPMRWRSAFSSLSAPTTMHAPSTACRCRCAVWSGVRR